MSPRSTFQQLRQLVEAPPPQQAPIGVMRSSSPAVMTAPAAAPSAALGPHRSGASTCAKVDRRARPAAGRSAPVGPSPGAPATRGPATHRGQDRARAPAPPSGRQRAAADAQPARRAARRARRRSRQRLRQHVDDPIDVAVGQPGVQRQAQGPPGQPVGHRRRRPGRPGRARRTRRRCAAAGSGRSCRCSAPAARRSPRPRSTPSGSTTTKRWSAERSSSARRDHAQAVDAPPSGRRYRRDQLSAPGLHGVEAGQLAAGQRGQHVGQVGLEPGLDDVVGRVGPDAVAVPGVVRHPVEAVAAGERGQLGSCGGQGARPRPRSGSSWRRTRSRRRRCPRPAMGPRWSVAPRAWAASSTTRDAGRCGQVEDRPVDRHAAEVHDHQGVEALGRGRPRAPSGETFSVSGVDVEQDRHAARVDHRGRPRRRRSRWARRPRAPGASRRDATAISRAAVHDDMAMTWGAPGRPARPRALALRAGAQPAGAQHPG